MQRVTKENPLSVTEDRCETPQRKVAAPAGAAEGFPGSLAPQAASLAEGIPQGRALPGTASWRRAP